MATAREVLAGKAAVELTLRDRLQAGIKGAESKLRRFAVNVAAIGVSFAAVQYAASRAMGIVTGALTGPADHLQNLSDRTGITVEMLQALGEAGADSGGTLEDVGSAARAMANFLQQVEHGAGAANTTLSELGVSAEALATASQNERIEILADALDGIADPARRAALAQDVFGRGAMALLPVLSGGSKKIEAYRKRLQEVGGLRTAEQIAAADELGDSFGRLGRRITALATAGLGSIAPAVTRIVDAMIGAVEITGKWAKETTMLTSTFELFDDVATTMMGGIFDAITAANLGLAMDIAMAEVVLAWTIHWGTIQYATATILGSITESITKAFTNAVAEVASILDELVKIYNQVAGAIGATAISLNLEGMTRGVGRAVEAAARESARGVREQVAAEIGKAGADLARLQGQAAREAEARRSALAVERAKGDEADKPDGGMEDRAKEISRQLSHGTFSATVAGALGRGTAADRNAQEMLVTAHDQLEELRKIEKKIGGKVVVGA